MKELTSDNLRIARVRLRKDTKKYRDDTPRFLFEFHPSHKLPPADAAGVRFRTRDLLAMFEAASQKMTGEHDVGLGIQRLYNKITEDAVKMLVAKVRAT